MRITKHDIIGASVLSGNRNFEARIHQSVKANFLMSPPLVVAFAIAGRIDIDLTREPLAVIDGREVSFCATCGRRRRRSMHSSGARSIPPNTKRSMPDLPAKTRCGTRFPPRWDQLYRMGSGVHVHP